MHGDFFIFFLFFLLLGEGGMRDSLQDVVAREVGVRKITRVIIITTQHFRRIWGGSMFWLPLTIENRDSTIP